MNFSSHAEIRMERPLNIPYTINLTAENFKDYITRNFYENQNTLGNAHSSLSSIIITNFFLLNFLLCCIKSLFRKNLDDIIILYFLY